MLTGCSSFFMSFIWLRGGVVDKVSSWHQRNGCSFLGFIAVVGCLCRSAKKTLMFISTVFSYFIENPYFLGIFVYMPSLKQATGNHHLETGHQNCKGQHLQLKKNSCSGAFDVSLLRECTLPTTPPKNKWLEPKNTGLEFRISLQRSDFQVPAVCFGGSRWWILMILFFTSFHLESFFRVFVFTIQSSVVSNHPAFHPCSLQIWPFSSKPGSLETSSGFRSTKKVASVGLSDPCLFGGQKFNLQAPPNLEITGTHRWFLCFFPQRPPTSVISWNFNVAWGP